MTLSIIGDYAKRYTFCYLYEFVEESENSF